MMPHRPPTRFDIGREVEVSRNGDEWQSGILDYVVIGDNGPLYYMDPWTNGFTHCRVPYTTPDPIAELSAAADWLAERGQDEAARVLMLYLSLADIDKQRLGMYQAGDSLTVWQTMLNEFQHAGFETRPQRREPNHVH